MESINVLNFFVLMLVLQLADMYTTYKGLKNANVKETNGLLAKLMQKTSVVGALALVKSVFLILLWFYPITNFAIQVSLILVYAVVLGNNLKVLKSVG